jgi:membrane protease YdiL (CAAX protease family)
VNPADAPAPPAGPPRTGRRTRIDPRRAAHVAAAVPRRWGRVFDGRHPVLVSVGVLLATFLVLALGDLLGPLVLAEVPPGGAHAEEWGEAASDLVARLLAAAAATGLVLWLGWWRHAGFTPVREWSNPHLYWLPALLVGFVLVVGAMRYGASPGWLALTVPGAFATGYLEELVIRGIILLVLLRAWRHRPRGALAAVLVSGLIFGLAHYANLADPDPRPLGVTAQVLTTTFVGIGFGALVVRTNTLWPAVVLHWLNNAAVQALPGPTPTDPDEPDVLNLAPVLLFLPLALYGLFLLRRTRSERAGAAHADPA